MNAKVNLPDEQLDTVNGVTLCEEELGMVGGGEGFESGNPYL